MTTVTGKELLSMNGQGGSQAGRRYDGVEERIRPNRKAPVTFRSARMTAKHTDISKRDNDQLYLSSLPSNDNNVDDTGAPPLPLELTPDARPPAESVHLKGTGLDPQRHTESNRPTSTPSRTPRSQMLNASKSNLSNNPESKVAKSLTKLRLEKRSRGAGTAVINNEIVSPA
uniref:(northern house mosquito) hypothetical protein n=1 Tax=Culex pipiens TaxID=7175 RepID=A0A8D8CDU5_CULPI